MRCTLGRAGLSKNEKDEAWRKLGELGAERERQSGIK